MTKSLSHILMSAVLLTLFCPSVSAQFQQTRVEQDNEREDKGDTVKIFSIKDYFAGLNHKKETTLGTNFIGSTFIIGGMQIYEEKKWKLPIVYGGIGSTLGMGIGFDVAYKNSIPAPDPITGEALPGNSTYKNLSTAMYISAGVLYWATLMDGAICYKSDIKPLPARSTVFSALLPGLGQIYNGEAWKVPIYLGLMGTGVYLTSYFNQQYVRYYNLYVENPSSSGYKSQKNTWRRYRDYAIIGTAAMYVLQIIDANVFAFMQNFEVNDNISMDISPAVITPNTQYAINAPATSFGLRIGVSF